MAIAGRCCCHATSNGNRSPLTGSWISPFTGRCGRATDPPLTSIVAMAAARRNGAQLVNWIRYIYLETAVDWECHSCAAHSPRSLMAWALSLPETDARSTREFFDTVEDDRS